MACFRHFSSSLLIGLVLLMMVGLTGCLNLMATDAEPLDPTRTPIPTFTPTDIPPTADVAATEAAQAAMAQATANAAATAAAAPTDTPVPSEPTATPTPDSAVAVVNQGMNVRNGPGTNYSIIGAAQAGDQYVITGKDNSGAWWQVDFNGQSGWLFGQLVTASNSSGVAVAQNIPAPPPPTNTPVPAPTQAPAPTQPPAPPSPTYKFNVVVVSRCERQPAGNWFEGKTYVNGQPASGYKVVFSYAADGPPITSPVVTGPHPGYEGWDAGYYSHIINASGPKAGTWYVWVVDDSGNRISEIGQWTSTGPGDGCNQAVVDFDSR
ncbi:MAG TPA: SH3 domain-containing protein [Caldilineaceae bacterium]|nr:SH3 domain-containing protein [Caldilineaceae bacterium]